MATTSTVEETHGDLDLGRCRRSAPAGGLTVRNVTDAGFGDGDDAFELKRQARAGCRARDVAGMASPALTVAVDADLTTTATAVRRRAACRARRRSVAGRTARSACAAA